MKPNRTIKPREGRTAKKEKLLAKEKDGRKSKVDPAKETDKGAKENKKPPIVIVPPPTKKGRGRRANRPRRSAHVHPATAYNNPNKRNVQSSKVAQRKVGK